MKKLFDIIDLANGKTLFVSAEKISVKLGYTESNRKVDEPVAPQKTI